MIQSLLLHRPDPARPAAAVLPRGRGEGMAASHLVPSVFHQEWWLAAAGEGEVREATVEQAGRLVARLPYLPARTALGLRRIVMPPLTPVLGPALAPELTADPATAALRHFTMVRDLVRQLPRSVPASFRLHRGVENGLAFQQAGFATSVDFTIEIAPAEPEVQWRRLRDRTRLAIRRARARLAVADLTDPDAFLDVYEANLRERKRRNARPRRIARAVMAEALRRDAGRLLAALRPDGSIDAAIFTAWDGQGEHHLLTTRSIRSAPGAVSLLVWHALQDAAAHGLVFDTDGLIAEHNLMLMAGFGGVFRPRYTVTRTTDASRFAATAMARARSLLQMGRPEQAGG